MAHNQKLCALLLAGIYRRLISISACAAAHPGEVILQWNRQGYKNLSGLHQSPVDSGKALASAISFISPRFGSNSRNPAKRRCSMKIPANGWMDGVAKLDSLMLHWPAGYLLL